MELFSDASSAWLQMQSQAARLLVRDRDLLRDKLSESPRHLSPESGRKHSTTLVRFRDASAPREAPDCVRGGLLRRPRVAYQAACADAASRGDWRCGEELRGGRGA